MLTNLLSDRRWRAVAAAFMLNGLLFGVWACAGVKNEHFEPDHGTLGLL